MTDWYKAVCDEHKEMIDIFVRNAHYTAHMLSEHDEEIQLWLSLHWNCDLRLIHRDQDLDKAFDAGVEKVRFGRRKDPSKYTSVREMNCMKCRKPGRCEVTFEYNESGKVTSAKVTRMEDDWDYKPFGDAGGKAPYCPDCL